MDQLPKDQPHMVAISGRPTKVLVEPRGEILVACRTAQGEDVYVPLSALFTSFEQGVVANIRTRGEIK